VTVRSFSIQQYAPTCWRYACYSSVTSYTYLRWQSVVFGITHQSNNTVCAYSLCKNFQISASFHKKYTSNMAACYDSKVSDISVSHVRATTVP